MGWGHPAQNELVISAQLESSSGKPGATGNACRSAARGRSARCAAPAAVAASRDQRQQAQRTKAAPRATRLLSERHSDTVFRFASAKGFRARI
jgi:hypothetical protein